MKKDSLGTRIKQNYENVTRYHLPRRSYYILRLDGKAFHTYTRNLPAFDEKLLKDLKTSTLFLIKEMQGAILAYLQSDEISILFTDIQKINTNLWFDGNIQKICSVASSIFSVNFNKLQNSNKMAYFDARVFSIPDKIEVCNYFIWRQKDCLRNAISSTAREHFSHKELLNKNSAEMIDMLYGKNINWERVSSERKHGTIISKDGQWRSEPAYIFSDNFEKFSNLIPDHGY